MSSHSKFNSLKSKMIYGLFLLMTSHFIQDAEASLSNSLDGIWHFESSSSKSNKVFYLPTGDQLTLNIRGNQGEIVLTPGNPGMLELAIKNLCSKIHGTGKITFKPTHLQTQAQAQTQSKSTSSEREGEFLLTKIKGENDDSLCPATQLLSVLIGKETTNPLKKTSMSFDFKSKRTGDKLTLVTTYKKEKVTLYLFKK